ncbi:HNH endonuclease [Amycolatopsis sp. NPDC003865]
MLPAGNRCPTCSPSWGRASPSWSAGSTRRWRRLRAAQLASQPLCQRAGCRHLATEVDHVQPLSEGGERYDPSNLQSLCRDCHQAKTQQESTRARRIASAHDRPQGTTG